MTRVSGFWTSLLVAILLSLSLASCGSEPPLRNAATGSASPSAGIAEPPPLVAKGFDYAPAPADLVAAIQVLVSKPKGMYGAVFIHSIVTSSGTQVGILIRLPVSSLYSGFWHGSERDATVRSELGRIGQSNAKAHWVTLSDHRVLLLLAGAQGPDVSLFGWFDRDMFSVLATAPSRQAAGEAYLRLALREGPATPSD